MNKIRKRHRMNSNVYIRRAPALGDQRRVMQLCRSVSDASRFPLLGVHRLRRDDPRGTRPEWGIPVRCHPQHLTSHRHVMPPPNRMDGPPQGRSHSPSYPERASTDQHIFRPVRPESPHLGWDSSGTEEDTARKVATTPAETKGQEVVCGTACHAQFLGRMPDT